MKSELLLEIKSLPPELQYKIWQARERRQLIHDWTCAILCAVMAATVTIRPLNEWLDKVIPVGPVVHTAKPTKPGGTVDRERMAKIALSMKGMRTSHGPDGGRNACAWWVVGHVVKQSTGGTLGLNPNWVPDIQSDLQKGYGRRVTKEKAAPGHIVLVVTPTAGHIGMVVKIDGKLRVLSTSSRIGGYPQVGWVSDLDFDGYYGAPTEVYEVLKVRRN